MIAYLLAHRLHNNLESFPRTFRAGSSLATPRSRVLSDNLLQEKGGVFYRGTLPLLQQSEHDTWDHRSTCIVFTCSKGLRGAGFSCPEWKEINDAKSDTVSGTITDDTLPGGPRQRTITYEAPFDRCDREQDYETAWTHFASRASTESRS